MRWFGARVVEIKQISAYSCRGMNGNPQCAYFRTRLRQRAGYRGVHAGRRPAHFGGDGWKGMPEEQGFLHDVQASACREFTTVLAPGSNVYHYNHIHVDLMRRARRPVICEPAAMSGRGSRRARRAAQSLCLPRARRHGIARRRQSPGAASQGAGKKTNSKTSSAGPRPMRSVGPGPIRREKHPRRAFDHVRDALARRRRRGLENERQKQRRLAHQHELRRRQLAVVDRKIAGPTWTSR